VGVNAYLSKALGEGDREKANRTAGNGILLTLIAAAGFLIFGIFGAEAFFKTQSEVAETVEGGAAYLSICCIFSVGVLISILCERLLQATGRTVHTMITQGVGAITNIILDPVFIFGVDFLGIPAMGIAGAAVATVVGQWVSATLGIFFNLKLNPDVQFGLRYMKPDRKIIGPVLSVGVPAIVMNSIVSIMTFGMNKILQGFNETATGVFGIYFKLQSFFFMPLFGINNATISIIAFNYGARRPDRITGTLKRSALSAMTIMLLGLLAFQLLPDLLLGIFEPSDEFLRIGRQALRTISFHFPLAAIGISLGACFQALGNGIYSTIVSLCRQLVALLPAAYLLSLSGEVTHVWWSFPIAEVVSVAVTLFLFWRIYKQKIQPLIDHNK
jgi:putative MATE family efflux protein